MKPASQPLARTRRTLLVPDIAWVEIPGGSFVYGRKPDDRRELPTFWLARFPVTNRQYEAFLDDGGYEDERWWRDLRKPEPETSTWPQGNRPRTNVSWYEAVAFCRWLSARLVDAEDSIRLPTEVEWAKAARGAKGLVYPWGDEYRSGFANVDETVRGDGPWYLAQTTAVGMYPHGASPYGVEDMAGTVWEWCLNKREDVDDVTIDGSNAARGLRGGTWSHYPRNARAVVRDGDGPGSRYRGRGFRVLSSVRVGGR